MTPERSNSIIRVELWPIVDARAKELALTLEAFCALQPENLLLKHGHDPAKIGAGFKVSPALQALLDVVKEVFTTPTRKRSATR
jgi:hypothetical protein